MGINLSFWLRFYKSYFLKKQEKTINFMSISFDPLTTFYLAGTILVLFLLFLGLVGYPTIRHGKSKK